MKRGLILAIILFSSALNVGQVASAETKCWNAVPLKYMRTLPKYCQLICRSLLQSKRATENGTRHSVPRRPPYTWLHMHHYCQAIYYEKVGDGKFGESGRPTYNYQLAVANYYYSVSRWASDFILSVEGNVRIGRTLIKSGKLSESRPYFEKAIRGRPDYAPAYVALSEYYLKVNDPKGARDVLEQGLKRTNGKGANHIRRKLAAIK